MRESLLHFVRWPSASTCFPFLFFKRVTFLKSLLLFCLFNFNTFIQTQVFAGEPTETHTLTSQQNASVRDQYLLQVDWNLNDHHSKATENAVRFVTNFGTILEQASQMVVEYEAFIDQKRIEFSDTFDEMVDKGDERLKHSNDFQKAQITYINRQPIYRVVDLRTGDSILFADPDHIDSESAHFKQYVARQHRYAGTTGRNVVLIWTKGGLGEAKEIELKPKPKVTQKLWWKEFWQAIYAKPEKADITLAAICAVTQATAAGCMSLAQYALDKSPQAHFDYRPAALSAMFGISIGIFSTTYRNFTSQGTRVGRVIKSSFNSVLFAYSLSIWQEGGIHHLSMLDLGNTTQTAMQAITMAGVLANASILSNVVLNNYSKDYWNDPIRMREKMGINKGPFKVTFPSWIPGIGGKTWEPGFKRQSFEFQMIYLVPFTIRLADLIHFSVPVPILGNVHAGKILLWGSIPIAFRLALRQAEIWGFEGAPEYRARWEKFKSYFNLSAHASNAIEAVIAEMDRSAEGELEKNPMSIAKGVGSAVASVIDRASFSAYEKTMGCVAYLKSAFTPQSGERARNPWSRSLTVEPGN